MMLNGAAAMAVLFTLQVAFAQDFHRTYDLPPGGQIKIVNVLGDIRVTGYDGRRIEVKGVKTGAGREAIQIDDFSGGHRIAIFTRHLPFQRGGAGVEFELRVPKSVAYNFTLISSLDGDVAASSVTGSLWAKSERGNVEVRGVGGRVSATSISGNVIAEIGKTQATSHMRLSSVSGNIDVVAPSDLDALVNMSSSNGPLRSDFPIDIQELRYGTGRLGRGKLGSGRQVLHVSSVSGRVSLVQK